MRKISTFFEKDPLDLGRVIDKVSPDNTWVITESAVPTRKYDGTAVAIINGELYKRYDAKKGKTPPLGAIPCQDPDPISGHWPHWVKCDPDKKEDRYFFEGLNNSLSKGILDLNFDATYELCGPKIQGNPEKLTEHELVPHGVSLTPHLDCFSFDCIKDYLIKYDIEGIVFWGKGGKMCKIRKSDFGIKR